MAIENKDKKVLHERYFSEKISMVLIDHADPETLTCITIHNPNRKIHELARECIENIQVDEYTNTIYGRIKVKDIDRIRECERKNKLEIEILDHWFETQTLPDGRLYSIEDGKAIETEVTPDDLAEDFYKIDHYKQRGFIKISGVVDVVYVPSMIYNHAFKDDYLLIDYEREIKEDRLLKLENSTYFLFGNDILFALLELEKKNPHLQDKVDKIKEQMVEKYNKFVDEFNEMLFNFENNKLDKINKLEELVKD